MNHVKIQMDIIVNRMSCHFLLQFLSSKLVAAELNSVFAVPTCNLHNAIQYTIDIAYLSLYLSIYTQPMCVAAGDAIVIVVQLEIKQQH